MSEEINLDQCSTLQSRARSATKSLAKKFGVTVSAFGAASPQRRSQQDARLSIAALRAVNNLPASYRAYEEFSGIIKRGFPRFRLTKRKEKPMKLTTIALALAFTLPATFALAQAPMNLPGTEYRTTGVTVGQPGTEYRTTGVTAGQTGPIATRPWNISGNTMGPINVKANPSGSTLTPGALVRGD